VKALRYSKRRAGVGDYVKLDSGQEGYVADFSWRSTRLRMLANNLVLVPNARLAQASSSTSICRRAIWRYSSKSAWITRATSRTFERVVADVGGEVSPGTTARAGP
jgi:hypothetical protein